MQNSYYLGEAKIWGAKAYYLPVGDAHGRLLVAYKAGQWNVGDLILVLDQKYCHTTGKGDFIWGVNHSQQQFTPRF